jgi:hypothetical protein
MYPFHTIHQYCTIAAEIKKISRLLSMKSAVNILGLRWNEIKGKHGIGRREYPGIFSYT